MTLIEKIAAAIQDQRGEIARLRASHKVEETQALATLMELQVLQSEITGPVQALIARLRAVKLDDTP